MIMPKIALQRAGDGRVSAILKEAVEARGFDTMGIAVAFASVAGITELLDSILAGRLPARSYWLFGLDSCITHPDAIERAMKLEGAQVRIADGQRGVWIFHPKLYWFSGDESNSSLVMGSANLTAGGLGGNVEAVAALKAMSRTQSEALDEVWSATWKLGRMMTPRLLAAYRRDFDLARKARKKAGLLTDKESGKARKRSSLVLASDDARVDPSLATKCWIEVGKITGFKQDQLEIKAEQALFFGWPADGGGSQVLNVRLVSGATVEIAAHYYGNHMWRLLMPQSIPEVEAGLRTRRGGKLLRSSYVAVFSRKRKWVELRFIRFSSPEFKALRKATEHAGTLGSTATREYGWV